MAANKVINAVYEQVQKRNAGETEFLQAVKSDPALAPIPVVVLTTSQERRDIQQSFDRHAAGYVVKPVDYAATVGALRIIENYWSLSYLPACHT